MNDASACFPNIAPQARMSSHSGSTNIRHSRSHICTNRTRPGRPNAPPKTPRMPTNRINAPSTSARNRANLSDFFNGWLRALGETVFGVESLGGVKVCLMGLFSGRECAEIDFFAVKIGTGYPSVCVPINTSWFFCALACFQIALVLLMRCFSKIVPTVIQPIPIPMINFIYGFISCHPFPDYAVQQNITAGKRRAQIDNAAIHFDFPSAWIPSRSAVAGLPSAFGREVVTRSNTPCDPACLLVIINRLAQKLCAWHNLGNHFVLLRWTMARNAACPGKGGSVSLMAYPFLAINLYANVGVV